MRRIPLHTEQGERSGSGRQRLTWLRSAGAGLAIACLVSTAGAAEYRVGIGDVVEILVARVPELQRRVTVQPDGRISFPMLGSLPVAGLLPSEMEARIQAMMAAKVFRLRSSDGREQAVAIEANEITASVAQYRPVYVKGDVAKPGELPFRPLMTVRQLIAVSGGYDPLRQRTENPVLLSTELSNEIQGLWIERVRTEARILRLKATLDGEGRLDPGRLTPSPVPASQIQEIAALEAEQLRADQSDYEREKSHLHRSIKQADQQIGLLVAQEAKEEQGTQADIEELKKVEEMFGKGALPSPRVTDARRAVLLSSTRKLQTSAQLMEVRKRQEESAWRLERLDDQRQIKLLHELQVARAALSQIQVKLQGAGEKLALLARGREFAPEVSIVRMGEAGRETIAASEDSELQPGDVVEVVLRQASSTTASSDRPPTAAGISKGRQLAAQAEPGIMAAGASGPPR